VAFFEILFYMGFRIQSREILVTIFALIRGNVSVVASRTRIHLRPGQIGGKLRRIDPCVTNQTLDLAIRDVVFVIDDKITNR
jgi:hypothetical protein